MILRMANTNFWISEILGMILGIITILAVKNTNNYTFAKKIVGFIFALLSILLLVYMSATLYLDETPNFVLAVFALIGVFIISSCRKEALNRTFYILFMFLIVMYMASQGMLMLEAKIENIKPLFNSSLKGTFASSIVFYLASVTPILSLNELKTRDDKKNMLINYVMASLSIILVSLTTVLVFGMNESTIYRYPEYVVLKRIKIYEFFTNVDNAFTIVMVIDLLVTAISGLRNMELKGKAAKSLVFVLLVSCVTFLSLHAGIMVMVYNLVPFILAILLILTLLPKKLQNKR